LSHKPEDKEKEMSLKTAAKHTHQQWQGIASRELAKAVTRYFVARQAAP
jgi:hypothetical protein